MSSLFNRPSTPASSSSSDEEEYTLCAYGDISLSNIYFIPSLSTTVTPRRDDSCMDKQKGKKTPPPSVRKKLTPKHALPRVIQKILPPSPSAAELSPRSDFERLVVLFRETRVSEASPPHTALELPWPAKPIQQLQPLPRRVAKRKAISKTNQKGVPAEERVPLQPSAHMNAAAAQPEEKPFRGGRLPVRPPLPRWDLR